MRLTPVLRAFSFHYTKIPQSTASYAIDVLLPRGDAWGTSARQVRKRIEGLLTAEESPVFRVGNESERVRIAGTSSTRATGEGDAGRITLLLIAIRGG